MKLFLRLSLGIVLIACEYSCTQHENLPQVTKLSNLKRTEFVPTLENDIPKNKNVIYAAAFLYAWDQVKLLFNSPILLTNTNSADLILLNRSNSFKNSLTKDEYEADAYLQDGEIVSTAFFKVTLPFPSKLQKITGGMLFGKKKVEAFGMDHLDEKIVDFSHILFYKDDDNFIIKLMPKDTMHEIILVKGLNDIKTFSDVIKQTNNLIKKGNREKKSAKDSWKYEFNDNDSYMVPVTKFNVETHYTTIEGQIFLADGIKRDISTANQRIALVLDENGAIVETHAMGVTDSVGHPPIIHPKNMAFDKPFFIIIKRADKLNPYFLMKVENTELLSEK